jgi:hypothetical protein
MCKMTCKNDVRAGISASVFRSTFHPNYGRIYSLPSLCLPVSPSSTLSKVSTLSHFSIIFFKKDRLFSDLIRHGKNHIHARQDDALSSSSAPPVDTHTHHQRAHPERRQQVTVQQPQQPQQQQQQPAKAQPVASKQSHQYTREVEKIVQEERAAKEKMPTYKGLERFKLIQKMGECASCCLDFPFHLMIICL